MTKAKNVIVVHFKLTATNFAAISSSGHVRLRPTTSTLRKMKNLMKLNAAQALEEDEIEEIWSTEAVGLQNPRLLLHLVWWNNVTHLGMRAQLFSDGRILYEAVVVLLEILKEQYDCFI